MTHLFASVLLHFGSRGSIIILTESGPKNKGPKQPDVLPARQACAGDQSTYITSFRWRSDDISITDWPILCKKWEYFIPRFLGLLASEDRSGLV